MRIPCPHSREITGQDLGPKLCSLRGGMMKIKSSCFLTLSNASKLFFFFSNVMLELLQKPRFPQKLFLSVGDCVRQCSPGSPGPQLRGAGAGSWTIAGSTVRTKVCMPTTSHIGGQDFAWVPWCMVLPSTAPTNHFCLWMDVESTLLRGQPKTKENLLFHHDANVTSLKTHFGPICLAMPAEELERKE